MKKIIVDAAMNDLLSLIIVGIVLLIGFLVVIYFAIEEHKRQKYDKLHCLVNSKCIKG